MIAIKRFSIKLKIPKWVFAYPPTHAQFNFSLSKENAFNTDAIPIMPRIKAIKITE